MSWSSNIPKRYKRNTINVDLHRCTLITEFPKEKKFSTADYPQKFIDSVIRNFTNDKIENTDKTELGLT